MKSRNFLRALLVLALAASASAQLRTIPSLTEPGAGLTVRSTSPQGLVTFASAAANGGILLKTPSAASAETRALSFVENYGQAFGFASASEAKVVRASAPDEGGIEHVRLQQVHRGVPVRGAEVIVHMKGSRVLVANGHATADLPDNVNPRLTAEMARASAQQLLEKHLAKDALGAKYGAARLEIFNRGLLSELGTYRSRLAWFVEATGPTLREFIWIDAQSGAVLMHFNQLATAKSRAVYTANHTDTLPGALVRSEGGAATGDTDEDNAYDFAGITYDYYFSNHSRDSFDGLGATIHSTAHYCEEPNCPDFENAFWNGEQMVYGDGFASADDVVGHELTHAVTDYTAGLFYYNQSGALNESYSDIFGETIDLTDGVGTDTLAVRWKLGEDLTGIGAIRDMMNPNLFNDPAKMSDSTYFVCSTEAATDPDQDNGGVHTNSGIPNHAYALMADGGTYNGHTVTAIGLTKAAKIQYRALTRYLTSGSNFIDNYNALNQSCTDLIGTVGIVAGDCTAVNEALLAVEMNATWACSGAVAAPALCTSGIPSFSQFDGFEAGPGHWTEGVDYGEWGIATGAAKEGVQSEYGDDPDDISDHKLTLTNALLIPAGGRLYFDHLFEFENSAVSGSNYDAGRIEYSTNGGSSWSDASSLIDAGKGYGPGLVSTCCTNPLAGLSAFVRSSFGYTGTRLDLSSLAGQNAKFRFRVASDDSIGSLGWVVDNVAFYSCVPSTFTDDPLVAGTTLIKKIHITELRARIDSLRIRRSLAPFSWTDPTITIGTTTAKAVHITEMRTALNAVYTARGVTLPTYTDPALTSGNSVKAVHIMELRAAVVAIE